MRLYLNEASRDVVNAEGARFDAWTWQWRPGGQAADTELTPVAALGEIAGRPGARRVPIGVIGPREPTRSQAGTARELGLALGRCGLTVVCGGRGGVMEAVCTGVREGGGLAVGLLPGNDWREANPAVMLPIATGLSEGRNMVIARSCLALIAVGGSYGTLTEVAYGLHFGKPVFGLDGAADVDGVRHLPSVTAAMEALAEFLLADTAM